MLRSAVFYMLFLGLSSSAGSADELATSRRSDRAEARQKQSLETALEARNLELGAPVFLRVFKESSELEVWVESTEGFSHFKTYPICTFSGELGPKLAEGDLQSPEGFYFVKAGQMNPWSRFHLSFNLGYPNAYDRHHGRTGAHLMIHGDCVSIGCYAMTDAGIEEIYSLTAAALRGGQKFLRVHAFPFRMTRERMATAQDSKWIDFWTNLKAGYDWFEEHGRPPDVEVRDGEYTFRKS